ncbi:MAG: DUF58 domain-containing protein [Bacteroidia bacterium]
MRPLWRIPWRVQERLIGMYPSLFKGIGVEFADFALYEIGDPPARIDWRRSLLTGKTLWRRYFEEKELFVFFLVDASASMRIPHLQKWDAIKTTVLILGQAAIRHNDRMQLMAYSDRIEILSPPGKGNRHLARLTNLLDTLRPQSRHTNLEKALQTVFRLRKKRSLIFWLSDFFAPLPHNLLKAAALRHQIWLIQLLHQHETLSLTRGYLPIQEVETGQTAYLHGKFQPLHVPFLPRLRRVLLQLPHPPIALQLLHKMATA